MKKYWSSESRQIGARCIDNVRSRPTFKNEYWVAKKTMRPKARYLFKITLLFQVFVLLGCPLCECFSEKVSEVGKYSGYSKPSFEGYIRTSEYITVKDGIKIAVDIFRPVSKGKLVEEPLPTIWCYERYHRASIGHDGKLITKLDRQPWLQEIVKHGYVVCVADVRGTGASYGTWDGPFTQSEAEDASDIIAWFASQPWCDGQIGMFGSSYCGINQFFAASKKPPNLKAIFVQMGFFDLYSFAYPGGVFRDNFALNWNRLVKKKDLSLSVAPVDGDHDCRALKKAVGEHIDNRNVHAMFSSLPYRSSIDEDTNTCPYLTQSPNTYIDAIRNSGIAVYLFTGWYDLWSRDAFLWFKNLNNRKKIVAGPWSHTQRDYFDLAAEHLRWYDYWLKGIQNGVMDEPPIHYYVIGASEKNAWQSAYDWPLPDAEMRYYYFHEGPSNTLNSVNDGVLKTTSPSVAQGSDAYMADYTTTSGKTTRWANGYGAEFAYSDMVYNDEKGLTYTSNTLSTDIQVTGHPVVEIWFTSTSENCDFFVYLEEVDASGRSHYVTEGVLRASHRAISTPPFDYLDLPFHRSFERDIEKISIQPAKLVFDLYPASNIFDAGHRLRVNITCADHDNAYTPRVFSTKINIYRDSSHPSHIVLPVITPKKPIFSLMQKRRKKFKQ